MIPAALTSACAWIIERVLAAFLGWRAWRSRQAEGKRARAEAKRVRDLTEAAVTPAERDEAASETFKNL